MDKIQNKFKPALFVLTVKIKYWLNGSLLKETSSLIIFFVLI